LTKATTW